MKREVEQKKYALSLTLTGRRFTRPGLARGYWMVELVTTGWLLSADRQ